MMNKLKYIVLIFISTCVFADFETKDCEELLQDNNINRFKCIVNFYPNENEKREIQFVTQNLVKRVVCRSNINIDKKELLKKMLKPNLKLTRIPSNCKVVLRDGKTMDAVFSIEPEFHLEKNEIGRATLNISDIEGLGFVGSILKRYLSTEKFNKKLAIDANRAFPLLFEKLSAL